MAKVDLVAIGAHIRQQRIDLGYTQQYMYEKLDVSQNHYSRIENGHVGMSFEILLQISDILKVSCDYILTGNVSQNDNCSFLVSYNRLSEKQKKYINDNIELLLKHNLK